MPTDLKYGEAILEHGDIPDDEPIFIFRARDVNLPDTLIAYHTKCENTGVSQFHKDLILENYHTIKKWQEEHPDRVKIPSSENYRKRVGG